MSHRAHRRIGTAVLAVITMGLGACGGEPADSASTVPNAKSPRVLETPEGAVLEMPAGCGPVPAELRGTWTYDLRPQDIPPEWADARTGRAERIYGPGYEYSSPVNGTGSAYNACVKGDVVHTSRGPDCPADAGNEMLRWKVDGDELTLTPLPENRCFLTNIHFGDPLRSRVLKRRGKVEGPGVTALPSELTGRWSMRTRPDEPPPEVSDIQTGTSRLRLAADGGASLVTPTGNVINLGGAEARAGQLRFSSSHGPCQDAWWAEYAYSVVGDRLTLKPLTDPCPYSSWHWAAHPWRRGG